MKLAPYPKYKDSGVEWLGEVPEGWEVTKIKRVAKRGYKTFIDGDWIESPYIKDEGIRLIQTGNIGIGIYKEQGFRYIDEDTFNNFGCTEIFSNDVLICRLAEPVGRSCLAPDLKEKMITSVDVCILKQSKQYDPRFIVYFLSSKYYLDYMDSLSRGSTRERISRSMLGDIEFVSPEVEEQQSIANFLDQKTAKIDELIKKNKRMVELLKEKRQAIISNAVTKGLDPEARMKDSGIEWIGKVPEGWEVRKLKYCDLVTMGQSPNSDDYNTTFVGLPFLQGNADFTELHPIPRIWCDTANKLAEGGDILLSVRAPIGAVNIADQKYGIGRGLCAIHAINSFQKYLYYVALCLDDELNSIGTGSTYTAVSVDEIKDVVIPQPPFFEQQSIANFLDQKTAKIDDLTQKIQSQIEKLKEYRQALISNVVTGKVKVVEL